MTNSVITPIKRDKVTLTLVNNIKNLEGKRYINRSTKYIVIK